MTIFFFNDCLPADKAQDEYVAALHSTLCEYKKLDANYDVCVVTTKNQANVALSPVISLKQCILQLPDNTERTYALKLFSKYPIGVFFDEDKHLEELVANNFTTTVDGETKDATNIAIAVYNDGFLFTLGLCEDLTNDELCISGENVNLNAINLYGYGRNTSYVESKIEELQEKLKSIFEKIADLIGGEVDIRDTFISDFNNLTTISQKSVYAKFKAARSRFNPVSADDKTIKDVTPTNGKKGPLYELRIISPLALRVYFSQQGGRTVLVNVCGKGLQTHDIAMAYSRL